MPCVTECDDSWLSAVLAAAAHRRGRVGRARRGATDGPVEEGCVGSGVGMQCFDFKGGIGTASRVHLRPTVGGYTVGVLVMTNHGDRESLLIDGVRVGEQLTDLTCPRSTARARASSSSRPTRRCCRTSFGGSRERAGMGLSRGGSHASNGSGEQLLAFSTANAVPLHGAPVHAAGDRRRPRGGRRSCPSIFRATVEATEEAVLNALLASHTMTGRDGNTLHALPVDRLLAILRSAGRTS